MSWATNMRQASFAGVQFDCLSTEDSRRYTQAIYQSPYSNDADPDFMGGDPEEFPIHAIFDGDDYEDQLAGLKVALDVGSGLLVHPVYGSMQVSVMSRNVRHDPDLVDGCILTISFIKCINNTVDPLFGDLPTAIPAGLAASVLVSPTARLTKLMNQASVLGTLAQIGNQIANGAQAVRQALGIVTTDIDDYLTPSDWISSLLADVSGLADPIIAGEGAIAQWRVMLGQISNIDGIFNAAAGGAVTINAVPEPLQQVSRSLVVAGTIGAAQALLTGETDNPVFTPPELAQVCADVRTTIQTAITAERAAAAQALASNPAGPAIPLQTTLQVTALKSAAATMQTQVQAMINLRPPFVTRSVEGLTCMRWLAFSLYGDHTRARELIRLNPQVADPALLYAGMQVFAYAT